MENLPEKSNRHFLRKKWERRGKLRKDGVGLLIQVGCSSLGYSAEFSVWDVGGSSIVLTSRIILMFLCRIELSHGIIDVDDANGFREESAAADAQVEYEPVEFEDCVKTFTAKQEIELTCSNCKHNRATMQNSFITLPDILVVTASRLV